jgi:hypothetical protein
LHRLSERSAAAKRADPDGDAWDTSLALDVAQTSIGWLSLVNC